MTNQELAIIDEPNIDDHFDIRTHNGTITVGNTARGTHRTFRIRTQKKDADFAPGERILSVLVGPDNTNDYLQIGFVKPVRNGYVSKPNRISNGEVYVLLWDKHNTDNNRRLVKTLLFPDHYKGLGMEYHHEGRCIKCDRPLTVPESIRSGIGPVCASRR